LAALKAEFPSAGYLVFGWGARDYYMARNPGIGDILRAVASGPAGMLVIPLKIAPEAFFGISNAVVIHVSPGGIERLSQLLWNYLATDEEGAPRRIGAGLYPESVFYASTGTYNLSHTCNTWTADAAGYRIASKRDRRRFRDSGPRPASTTFGGSKGACGADVKFTAGRDLL
jgi:hypothetical protein